MTALLVEDAEMARLRREMVLFGGGVRRCLVARRNRGYRALVVHSTQARVVVFDSQFWHTATAIT
jgi:hypothetical protein